MTLKKALLAAVATPLLFHSIASAQDITPSTSPSTMLENPAQNKIPIAAIGEKSDKNTEKTNNNSNSAQTKYSQSEYMRLKNLKDHAETNKALLTCLETGGEAVNCLRKTLDQGHVSTNLNISDIELIADHYHIVHVFVEISDSYDTNIWALGENGEFWSSHEPIYSFKQLNETLHEKKVPVTIFISHGFFSNLPSLSNIIGIAFLLLFAFSIASRAGSLKSGITANKLEPENIVPFDEIAGNDYLKSELREIAQGLKDPHSPVSKYIPSGMLFTGPPGCGKTLMAAAMAKESGLPFYHVSGSDFTQVFVGMGSLKLALLFSKLRRKNSILFIDEIDALARRRGITPGGGGTEYDNTLNKFLQLLDGADKKTKKDPKKRIFVIGATNNPEIIDPAVTRPDRLGRKVTFHLPDQKTRIKTAEIYLKSTPHEDEVTPEIIGQWTNGFSGADIKDLIKQATLAAFRHKRESITLADISEAVDLHLMGEPQDLTISKSDREITKWHETAHALAILVLQGSQTIRRITIQPRGSSLGSVAVVPPFESASVSLHDLLAFLITCLAGRSGEDMLYRDAPEKITTGASHDILQATNTARNIVETFGFSNAIGMTNHVSATDQPVIRSEAQMALSDATIRKLIICAKQQADKIIADHREGFINIMNALEENETITGEEAMKLMTSSQKPHPASVYIAPLLDILTEGQDKTERQDNHTPSPSPSPAMLAPPAS